MKKPDRRSKDPQKEMVERSRQRDAMVHDQQSRNLLANIIDTDEEIRLENGTIVTSIPNHNETTFNVINSKPELISILRELKRITYKCRREEEEIELRCEWRFAATVIDRLCLWISVTFTLVSTLAVLFSAPSLVVWWCTFHSCLLILALNNTELLVLGPSRIVKGNNPNMTVLTRDKTMGRLLRIGFVANLLTAWKCPIITTENKVDS